MEFLVMAVVVTTGILNAFLSTGYHRLQITLLWLWVYSMALVLVTFLFSVLFDYL